MDINEKIKDYLVTEEKVDEAVTKIFKGADTVSVDLNGIMKVNGTAINDASSLIKTIQKAMKAQKRMLDNPEIVG